MKIALCLLGSVIAFPASADVEKLWQFMGGQGCTVGADSRTAAVAAGFAPEEIDSAVDAVLANGTAQRQGDYILLKRQICRLRLPDGISSPYTVLSPEIVAITSDIDALSSQTVGRAAIWLTRATPSRRSSATRTRR